MRVNKQGWFYLVGSFELPHLWGVNCVKYCQSPNYISTPHLIRFQHNFCCQYGPSNRSVVKVFPSDNHQSSVNHFVLDFPNSTATDTTSPTLELRSLLVLADVSVPPLRIKTMKCLVLNNTFNLVSHLRRHHSLSFGDQSTFCTTTVSPPTEALVAFQCAYNSVISA